MKLSYATGLRCLKCDAEYPLGRFFEGCTRCRTTDLIANLFVSYDYEKLETKVKRSTIAERPASLGVWKYSELLPVGGHDFMITLGEGGTPLIHCKRLGAHLGLRNLYVKNESANPTWSFKDRLCAVAVSKGLELKAKLVTTASTGNLGASTAAYAAHAGLPSIIFTLPTVSRTMLALMQVYGAKIIPVSTAEGRWKLMSEGVRVHSWYPTGSYTVPTASGNPYGVQGYKTIGYEIMEQLAWKVPDLIVHPTCWGEGMFGTWLAAKEYYDLGWIDQLPQMLAAESEAGGPLSYALAEPEHRLLPVKTKRTIASSIATSISSYQGLRAVIDSSGNAIRMSDKELLEMQKEIASSEGIFVEASSAASVAAAGKLRQEGSLDASDTVVCVLTSSGLKDAQTSQLAQLRLPTIDANWQQFMQVLGDMDID